ncbi:MAG: HesA/MoeB/ThiF family protein [Synergistaceae bacterium]|nr:HesA/MoeB/ThiF family protein [Synergistaceae bacterium]
MSDKALQLIKEKAVDKNGRSVISFFLSREVARECGLSAKEVEILALMNGICPSRYERSIGTLGMEGQAKLLSSRAAVIGCGGLGGWIIEMLARAGVGEIVMIDGDVFDDNNLNRQLMCCEESIGTPKAKAAEYRVRLVNGAVTPLPRIEYIDEKNGIEFLNGCSVAIDALDSNRGRREVFHVCRELGIPFVHGAIGGFFGEIGVFYPEDKPLWEAEDIADKGIEAEKGNPPFTPAFIASLQVAETLKILAGLDGQLRDILLWFDLQCLDLQKIKFGGE